MSNDMDRFRAYHGIGADEEYEPVDCVCWHDQSMGCIGYLIYERGANNEPVFGRCPDCGYEHPAPPGCVTARMITTRDDYPEEDEE